MANEKRLRFFHFNDVYNADLAPFFIHKLKSDQEQVCFLRCVGVRVRGRF
jgi:hypothetical protein